MSSGCIRRISARPSPSPPEHKCAAEGGPTFKTSFALFNEAASRPAVEVLKLLDAALFNLVAGKPISAPDLASMQNIFYGTFDGINQNFPNTIKPYES